MFRNQLAKSLIFICLMGTAYAHERITNFATSIVIYEDASLTVAEHITVAAEGKDIVHGIVREFPTLYRDHYGNFYQVDFLIEKILLDGKPMPYHIKDAPNGKKIYIGDANIHLKPGTYTFAIVYRTNRQLGFFSEHDELYWNVTGNGWRLPIDKATAEIILPQKIDPEQIKVTAYTGFQGEQHQWFTSSFSNERVIKFQTTKKLKPYQGLTIVVGFPKGMVQPPSRMQEWWWFFTDNVHILFYFLGIILILLCFYRARRNNRIRKGNKPVIPLFYPPENFGAGHVRYVNNIGYDNTVLTADIVYMAVHGWITITYKKSFWKGLYTLEQKNKPTQEPYIELANLLFASSQEITISQSKMRTINKVRKKLESAYEKSSNKLFDFNTLTIFMAGGIALGTTALTFLVSTPPEFWFLIFVITYGFLLATGYTAVQSYTTQGFELKRAIDGFKMFLATTETERLKIIGSPPTKTPELYEKYLPYAIALGVEQQWTDQFKRVFDSLEKQGKPYTPMWYFGGHYRPFLITNFSSSFKSSFNSAISSASSRPGSSSGFGGGKGGSGGSSGGGGGGGGGGGW